MEYTNQIPRNDRGKKAFPKITEDEIEVWLQLTPAEVAAIWKCATFAVRPEYFQPYAWGATVGGEANSREANSRVFHDHLRKTTYWLVATYANHFTKAPIAQRGMSVSLRQRDFWESSDMTSPSSLLPDLVKEGRPRAGEWGEYPDCYPLCTADDVFKSLIARLTHPGSTVAAAAALESEDDEGLTSESEEGGEGEGFEMEIDPDEVEEENEVIMVGSDSEDGDNMGTPIKRKSKVVMAISKELNFNKKVNQKKKLSRYEWEGAGSEFDKSTPMTWGTGSKAEGGPGLGPADQAGISAEERADLDATKEIMSKIEAPDEDEKYITQEAIQWAKAGPAGKIDMAIRVACQTFARGNEALYLMEQRQERIKQHIATMVKLREECLRKQIGMNLVVEKYQKAAEEVLAERKVATGNNNVPPTILPPVRAVAREKIGPNKRRDIDFGEFYSREKITVPSSSTGRTTRASSAGHTMRVVETSKSASGVAQENGASPPPDIPSSGQHFDLGDIYKEFLEDPEYRRPARENERPSESSTSTQ